MFQSAVETRRYSGQWKVQLQLHLTIHQDVHRTLEEVSRLIPKPFLPKEQFVTVDLTPNFINDGELPLGGACTFEDTCLIRTAV